MPTYKDITIHSWYLTPQKGRCSCQRISHTIEIAGLHSKAGKRENKLLSAIPAIQPVRNENLKRMASGFGYRTDPFTKARKMHEGMDFTAKIGT
jgi:murein DD-endopeptidase MepM/ murein hydrolase activator NlpD